MGREPMKANTNEYFRARKRAAEYNEALYSREGAAERLGVSASTLADYELGNTKVMPVDKVVLMADLYNAPELMTRYCKNECPIHGYLPLATEEKNIQGIALRLLGGFDEENLQAMRKDIISITEDGEISDDEVPAMKDILKKLESMAEVISELKIASEKFLRGR
jgi:transcriptional regulator with XRE-family HTH domain